MGAPSCLLGPAGIPKLEDANDAGGRNSEQCTLILTEGDSAKSLAVAGLSVVGRDRFGVFPLMWEPWGAAGLRPRRLILLPLQACAVYASSPWIHRSRTCPTLRPSLLRLTHASAQG